MRVAVALVFAQWLMTLFDKVTSLNINDVLIVPVTFTIIVLVEDVPSLRFVESVIATLDFLQPAALPQHRFSTVVNGCKRQYTRGYDTGITMDT